MSRTFPHNHCALDDTVSATSLAPDWIAPDYHFSFTFLAPRTPNYFVLPPSHMAFSLAADKTS